MLTPVRTNSCLRPRFQLPAHQKIGKIGSLGRRAIAGRPGPHQSAGSLEQFALERPCVGHPPRRHNPCARASFGKGASVAAFAGIEGLKEFFERTSVRMRRQRGIGKTRDAGRGSIEVVRLKRRHVRPFEECKLCFNGRRMTFEPWQAAPGHSDEIEDTRDPDPQVAGAAVCELTRTGTAAQNGSRRWMKCAFSSCGNLCGEGEPAQADVRSSVGNSGGISQEIFSYG